MRYEWLLLPLIWASFILLILERLDILPALDEVFPAYGLLALALFYPLLYLLLRQRHARRRGMSLSRHDCLVGLWTLVMGLTYAFNVVVMHDMTRMLLTLSFFLAVMVMFYVTASLLFGAGGPFRLAPRPHPPGEPVWDRSMLPKAPRQPGERRLRFRKQLKRWGGGTVLAAGSIAAVIVWGARSSAGPYVPAELGIGSPIRLGENLVDVMERRGARPGEYGGIWEKIEGVYFQRIYYDGRYTTEKGDVTAGALSYIGYISEDMAYPSPRWYNRAIAERVIAICRRHYGKEGYSRTYYSIEKGSLDLDYVYFWKEWKVDEMHSAAVSWTETEVEGRPRLSFYIGRWNKPVTLPADTVEVEYREENPGIENCFE